MAGPSFSNIEDQPAFDPGLTIFDPDRAISTALLLQLATATASTTLQLCKPFVRSGFIDTADGSAPIQQDQ